MPNYLSAGRTDVLDVLLVKGALEAKSGVTATSAIVKAAPSQTADLQQWQDSATAVMARITANAQWSMAALSTNMVRLHTNMSGAPTTGNQWHIQPNDADLRLGLIRSGSHVVAHFGSGAGNPVMELQAYASQTGDMTQWQTNTGAALVKMTATGDLDFIASTRGPILVSPDGLVRRRVGIDNTGALTLTAV